MKQRFKNIKGTWKGFGFHGVGQRVGKESDYDGIKLKGGEDHVYITGNVEAVIEEFKQRDNKRMRRWIALRQKREAERARVQVNDHG